MEQGVSFEGFIKFIKSQPPEKEVKHHALWNACAVGQYAASITDHEDVDVGAIAEALFELEKEAVGEGYLVETSFMEFLNCNGLDVANTYGDLSKIYSSEVYVELLSDEYVFDTYCTL